MSSILESLPSAKQFTLYLLILFLIALNIGIAIINSTNERFIEPIRVKFLVISVVLKKI
jgi:hypothetical protein